MFTTAMEYKLLNKVLLIARVYKNFINIILFINKNALISIKVYKECSIVRKHPGECVFAERDCETGTRWRNGQEEEEEEEDEGGGPRESDGNRGTGRRGRKGGAPRPSEGTVGPTAEKAA